jgi:hypothetical protein
VSTGVSGQYCLRACRHLLAAVLYRVVLDVRNGDRNSRRAALWFVWSQEAERICGLLDLDVDDLRRALGYARPELDEEDWIDAEVGRWFSLVDFWQC